MPTSPAEQLFGPWQSLLQHTLAPAEVKKAHIRYPVEAMLEDGTKISLLGEGILQIEPEASAGLQLVISAGVHGNETAPIELCDALVSQLLAGTLRPINRALIVLGNPPAMRHAARYMDQNLNRLFDGAHRRIQDLSCREKVRAAELERQVSRFVTSGPPLFHYDLHTALRDSQREKFALYPYIPVTDGAGATTGKSIPSTQMGFLLASDVTTVLHHHKPQTTFSAWTANAFGAESFTLELGIVHPFGRNDLTRISALQETLSGLLQGRMPPDGTPAELERFKVVHEIVKTADDFVLNVADDVANFTRYRKGTLIWHDRKTEYRVEHEAEFIVFPNRAVPIGERVGLLLAPC